MKIVVLVSAEAEWQSLKQLLPTTDYAQTPFGEQAVVTLKGQPYHFMHGGWGKIAAGASAQYIIDTMHPDLIVNIGTCGGFEGYATHDQTIIATKTIVYDIVEKMGDPAEAIAAYTTSLDTAWLTKLPEYSQRGILVSADRDIVSEDVAVLIGDHNAVAGDWESGAIAWVAARNKTPVIIARGVSDMVSEHAAEALANLAVFEAGTNRVMRRLLSQLPDLTNQWRKNHS